jgi:Zinc knuckle
MGTEENSRSAGASGKSRSDRKNYKETHHESGNPELGGHVYTFGVPGQADRYRKTTEAIADYVGQKMMNEMWALVQNGKEADFPEPKDPGDKPTAAQMEKYKMQLQMSLDKADKYQSEKAKVFRLIIGQCVPAMKHKIEGDTKYPTLVEASDVTGLLQFMKELVYSTHSTQYEYWAMQASMKTLITMIQHDKESLASFSKKFLAQVEATEAMWGKLTPAKLKGQATGTQDAGRDKFLACLFLAGVNRHHYKDVIDELNNDFLLEKVNYPKDVPTMLAMLSNRRGGQKENKRLDAMNDGVPATSSFAQATHNKKKNVTCLKCGKKGHYANECPNKPTPVAAARVVEDADSNDDEKTEQKYAWYGPIK